MTKNLVSYFDKTDINWKNWRDSSLLNFYFHTRLYLNNFNFATADGLDNLRSNLFTLQKEVEKELNERGIRVD